MKKTLSLLVVAALVGLAAVGCDPAPKDDAAKTPAPTAAAKPAK